MTETDARLVAYADGELDPAAAGEVERLLEQKPAARRAVEIYRETAALLRAACGEHLYAEGSERLMPRRAPVRRWAPRHRLALGTAMAACVVGFLGGWQWAHSGPAPGPSLAVEAAEYHAVFSRESQRMVEIPADRAEEITAWFGDRLHRPITVPDLSAEGLRFAGARMLVFAGRPLALFMYTRANGRPIGFCITLSDGRSPVRVEQHDGERTAVWQEGSYAYVVVGDVSEDAIRRIAADAGRQVQG